jgi:hypothetical protein
MLRRKIEAFSVLIKGYFMTNDEFMHIQETSLVTCTDLHCFSFGFPLFSFQLKVILCHLLMMSLCTKN